MPAPPLGPGPRSDIPRTATPPPPGVIVFGGFASPRSPLLHGAQPRPFPKQTRPPECTALRARSPSAAPCTLELRNVTRWFVKAAGACSPPAFAPSASMCPRILVPPEWASIRVPGTPGGGGRAARDRRGFPPPLICGPQRRPGQRRPHATCAQGDAWEGQTTRKAPLKCFFHPLARDGERPVAGPAGFVPPSWRLRPSEAQGLPGARGR